MAVVTSCSTVLKTTTDVVKPMDAAKILRKVNREVPKYRTYEIDRVVVTILDGEIRNSFTGQIRIEKDKQALVTVRKMNMPLARGYMSADSLKLVNFIERNYISDDVGVLKQLLGFNLEFAVLQALLTADAASFIGKTDFEREMVSSIDSFMYRIDSHLSRDVSSAVRQGNTRQLLRYMEELDNSEFVKYSVWIDPQLFVVRKLLINDIKKQQDITILYDNYQKVGRSYFPQTTNVTVDTAFGRVSLNLKMSRQAVNKARDFEFSIPSKYDKLVLPRN
ncbi:MAG: DUF4292 domain-containing protein [Prolixibacteraceae bacterium]|nr:DUF4292 domain-containing protein [Prolixibacteraceae bacterium]